VVVPRLILARAVPSTSASTAIVATIVSKSRDDLHTIVIGS